MKKFTFLTAIIPLLILVFFTSSLFAQNAPIGCNGQYYVSHGPISNANGSTQLEKLAFSGLTVTPNSFTLSPSTYGFNAMGINPVDGYIYAIRYPADNSSKARLLKIGSGGTNVTDLGAIAALNNGETAFSATFDATGIFYFTTDDGRFMKINDIIGSPLVASQIIASGFDGFADIAINPLDGQMYGSENSSSDWFFKINKTTGAITSVAGEPSLGGSNFFAALFFDETGNLFGYRSDGPFYLINKTTGALTAGGTGTSYNGADGCSCSFGRVFHELDIDPNEVCSTQGNPNPVFSMNVSVVNQSIAQQTALTYTLDVPGNRFSFNESAATIATNLAAAGVLPSANAAFVTISSTSGTNNKIVITSFQTGAATLTKTFALQLKLTTIGGVYSPVAIQSEISGLTPVLGLTDLSNDPDTPSPDDATVVTFCSNITLPVNLLSFSGVYKNNAASLSWEADNQVNFAFYDLERSIDGSHFSSITIKAAQNGTSGKQQYQYSDDLSSENADVFYYRLRMVDIDGSAKYSNVVMIRKDEKNIQSLSVVPNPVSHDMATIRFKATETGTAEIRIINMAGKLVLSQKNNVYEGINSLSINNLNRLEVGTYLLQLVNDQTIMNSKFVISRY